MKSIRTKYKPVELYNLKPTKFLNILFVLKNKFEPCDY